VGIGLLFSNVLIYFSIEGWVPNPEEIRRNTQAKIEGWVPKPACSGDRFVIF
jgi:hypothetical protein